MSQTGLAVFATLNDHVPAPRIEKVRSALGEELRSLWPEP